jgi:hypothetical protein
LRSARRSNHRKENFTRRITWELRKSIKLSNIIKPKAPPAPPTPAPTVSEVSQSTATGADGYDSRKTKRKGRSATIMTGLNGCRRKNINIR